jgi:hypothetical protein
MNHCHGQLLNDRPQRKRREVRQRRNHHDHTDQQSYKQGAMRWQP